MRRDWLLSATFLLLAALPVRAEGELPAVLARFAVQHAGGAPEQLVVVRTDTRIEHRFVTRGVVERWRRDARGELEHEKLFPKDGKSVHYTAGDLRTIQYEPSWEQLGSLIGTKERSGLSAAGQKKSLGGRTARISRGQVRGEPAQLEWLADVSLPALLATGHVRERTTVKLVSIEPCSESTCAETPSDALRSIEFADLGDMEYDPFVRRFMAREMPGHHAH